MGERTLPDILSVLQEVCAQDGYEFECLDEYSKQLVKVSWGEHSFFSGAGRVSTYPINSAASASVARDKVFAYQALSAAGFDAPAFEYFFLHDAYRHVRGDGRERDDAMAYALATGFPLFVKPLDGARGALTDIVFDAAGLAAHLDRIARVHHGVILQKVLTGPEYRLFVIDGDAMFLYRREPPFLRGDGGSTIGELLAARNLKVEAIGISPVDPQSGFLQQELKQRDQTLSSVPANGAAIRFSPAANVSGGGEINDLEEFPNAALAGWGARAIAALNLRLGAIDFFAPDGLDDPTRLQIIEVNSNPSLSGLIHAGGRPIARKILRRCCAIAFARPIAP
jgi:hypothetical protein